MSTMNMNNLFFNLPIIKSLILNNTFFKEEDYIELKETERYDQGGNTIICFNSEKEQISMSIKRNEDINALMVVIINLKNGNETHTYFKGNDYKSDEFYKFEKDIESFFIGETFEELVDLCLEE